jgi:hypothetical protein
MTIKLGQVWVWVLHPTDVSVEPFFSFAGLEMAIKPVGLGFAPDGKGCRAIFSPTGLAKSDPVIFNPFLKTEEHIFDPFLKTRRASEIQQMQTQFFTRLFHHE